MNINFVHLVPTEQSTVYNILSMYLVPTYILYLSDRERQSNKAFTCDLYL